MFLNYLKTTLRFLARNKGFAFINVIGLSLGTFCCLYILLYVRDQFSYDRSFSRSGDMYRVVNKVGETRLGKPRIQATSTPPVAAALAADFPDEVYEKAAYLVDANFFQLFDFHFSAGDVDGALNCPNGIVLSKATADKLFGDDGAMGKDVFIQDGYGDNHFTVTGVVDESIGKSSIRAGLFIRADPGAFHFLADPSWEDHNFLYTFVKLRPGKDVSELERQLPGFLAKHAEDVTSSGRGVGGVGLQPISDMHTNGGYEGEMGKTVSRVFLGILKIIGAGRRELVLQFLAESFVLALIAVLITLYQLYFIQAVIVARDQQYRRGDFRNIAVTHR
jgi:putative ABC transport system permease protein